MPQREAGNETVLALLDHWTDEIAQGLAGMVHIFNPQLILIGGGVSAQQKLLIEPIAAKVKASVMPAFAEGLEDTCRSAAQRCRYGGRSVLLPADHDEKE